MTGQAREFWGHFRRKMRLGERNIDEKGLLRLNIALHEIDRALRQFNIDLAAFFNIVDPELLRRLTLSAFHQVLKMCVGGIEIPVRCPKAFVR